MKKYKAGQVKRKLQNGLRLSPISIRILSRIALNGFVRASELLGSLNLPIGMRSVKEIIKADPQLRYRKMQKEPSFTAHNRLLRVKWVRNFISKGDHLWPKVVLPMRKNLFLIGQMA